MKQPLLAPETKSRLGALVWDSERAGARSGRASAVAIGSSTALVLLALAVVTVLAVVIDVRTRVSVAAVGWLYLLVIVPVTLRWGRATGLATAGVAAFLLITFLTEPRGLPYTKNGIDLMRLLISIGCLAVAVLLIRPAAREQSHDSRALERPIPPMNDAIVSQSLDGTIVGWNAAAQRLFGYCAEEMIGCPASRLGLPDRWGEFADLAAHLQQRGLISHETSCTRKDGCALSVALTVTPIQGPGGTVTGTSTTVHDITTRRLVESALQASNELLAGAVDELGDALLLFDERGLLVLGNTRAARLLQCRSGLLPGTPFGALFAGPSTLHPSVHWDGLVRAPFSTFLAFDPDRTPAWLRVEMARLGVPRPFHTARYVLTLRDAVENAEPDGAQPIAWPRAQEYRDGAPHPLAALQRAEPGRADTETEPSAATGQAVADSSPQGQGLTHREIEVLSLIACSRSNQEIADELGISLNTVERHIANLYRKLQIHGRVHATAYALQHGLTKADTP